MPRKASNDRQRKLQQARQARYRERLREEKKPEASAVDIALAEAICATAADEDAALVKNPALKAHLSVIVKRARRELVARDFDYDVATALLQRRLHRVTG